MFEALGYLVHREGEKKNNRIDIKRKKNIKLLGIRGVLAHILDTTCGGGGVGRER